MKFLKEKTILIQKHKPETLYKKILNTGYFKDCSVLYKYAEFVLEKSKEISIKPYIAKKGLQAHHVIPKAIITKVRHEQNRPGYFYHGNNRHNIVLLAEQEHNYCHRLLMEASIDQDIKHLVAGPNKYTTVV